MNTKYWNAITVRSATGGAGIVEGIGGAGAVVLAILALGGIMRMEFAAVAAISVGGGLLVGGGTIAARYSRFLNRMGVNEYGEVIAGGIVMESVCGLAGIALGILSLIGILSTTLLAAAAIVFGCGLLMASGAMARINSLPIRGSIDRESHAIARDTLYIASGSEVCVGLGGSNAGYSRLGWN